MRADGLESLSPEVGLCLFRVAQEALNNAVRHGRPRAIVVQLTATVGRSSTHHRRRHRFLAGEANGSGFGLRSIDERVRLTGGTLRVESRPGQGTTLHVEIPVAAAV